MSVHILSLTLTHAMYYWFLNMLCPGLTNFEQKARFLRKLLNIFPKSFYSIINLHFFGQKRYLCAHLSNHFEL